MQIAPWHWLILGLLLLIAELLLPSFACLWFGVAAIIVAGVALFVPWSFLTLVILWLSLSTLFCLAWFKFINPKIKMRTRAGLGASAIIGDTGMLLRVPVLEQSGIVRFNIPKAGASEWACRSSDQLQVGDRVVVLDIIGNELLVAKK